MVRAGTIAVWLAATVAALGAAEKYEAAMRLYSREDNVAAFEQLVEIIEDEPGTVGADRAGYLLSIIVEQKLRREQFAELKARLSKRHGYFLDYLSGCEAKKEGNNAAATVAFAEFIAASTNDHWRVLGIKALCEVPLRDTGFRSVRLETLERVLADVDRLNGSDCPQLLRGIAQPLINDAMKRGEYAKEARLRRLLYERDNRFDHDARRIVECYVRASLGGEETNFVEQVIARGPDQPETYSILVDAYSNVGNAEKARQLLERGFRRLGPKQPDLVVALSRLYEKQWRKADALHILEDMGPAYPPVVAERLQSLKKSLPEKYIPEWSCRFTNAVQIAIGPDGLLYVLVQDEQHRPDRLVALAQDGRIAEEIRLTDLQVRPCPFQAFAIYPDGTFQLESFHLNRRGASLQQIGLGCDVRDVSFTPQGDVVILAPGQGVSLVKTNGQMLARLEGAPGEFARASAVAADAQRIFVTEKTQVLIYDLEGKRQGIFANSEGEHSFRALSDIALDQRGFIYLADRGSACVWIYSPKFKFLTKVPISLNTVSVARDGAVYVEQGGIIKFTLRDGGAWALFGNTSQP